MTATGEKFVQLRNKTGLCSGQTNADFLQLVTESYEGGVQKESEMHSAAVQVNATQSVLQLHTQNQVMLPLNIIRT